MTILHLYKLMHTPRLRRPTPAGHFWLAYFAALALIVWVMA